MTSKWRKDKDGRNCDQEWKQACKQLMSAPHKVGPEERGEVAIEYTERLLAAARELAGVACTKCHGLGRYNYGSTATWQGDAGGASFTADVCDKCWGTGRSDQTGPNLRRILRLFNLSMN